MGLGNYLQSAYPFPMIPLHVCTLGRYNATATSLSFLGTPGVTTAGWPANNVALYVPVSLPTPFVIRRFMVPNGSNLTGTIDVGIYSSAGALLLSGGGGVARANASAVQYVDVTDTVFQAGTYYLGLVASSTTGTYALPSIANATRARWCGFLEETLGGSTLPSSMTPVIYTRTVVPQFGFTQSATL